MGNCWSGTARGLRRCCCWCGCCPIGPSSSSSYRVDVGVDNAAVAETSICQPVDAVSAATPAPPPPAGNDADADAKELEDELDAELDDMFGGRRRIVPRNAARNAPRRSLPKPPPESLEEAGKTLKVESVDLELKENGKCHSTHDYEPMERPQNGQLVVRRGQVFQLTLRLNRDYQPEDDAVSFVFTVADVERPSPSAATLVAVPVTTAAERRAGVWSATLIERGRHLLKIQVLTLATAIVGKWKMDIDTKSFSTNEALCFSLKQPFYLLFNPWCRDDQVYLEGEKERAEYVLADSGLIWRGSHSRMRPCAWNFAQFEADVLDCCLYLLSHVSRLTVAGRADAIRTVRAVSAAVNSIDDNGVLEGNWSDDYEGGTSPTKWSGSLRILQKYWETKSPVKYGQCWVFSGVVTTVCRALGIAARPVTNFSSAHDTHGSMTIDMFVGTDGKMMEELNSDMIWNFHVWNEVWMSRPDLEPGDYGGWQAIDATPQEESDGLYRCGPTSVAAVKRGEVRKPYDTAFQFAEVNADKIYWKYSGKNSPLKLIARKTDEVGVFISTKAVGKMEREDITDQYKFKENSNEEREVVLKALRQAESLYSRFYLNEVLEDVKFDFQLLDDVVIGSPFRVSVAVQNKSKRETFNAVVTLRVDSTLYTGKLKSLVKKETFQLSLKPGQVKDVVQTVTYDEYAPELSDQCSFNVACMAQVRETEFEYFVQDDFRVRKPDIRVDAPSQVRVGQPFEVSVSLRNPLPTSLNRAKFTLEGAGLGALQKVLLAAPVAVDDVARTVFQVTAAKAGARTVSAKFYSRELNDVDGFVVVDAVE